MTTQTEMTMNPVATNAFAWNEIATRDTEAVSTFYCALFGWTTKLAECTAGYTVFKLGENPIAGMNEMNDEWPEDTPTHWGSYIYVDDVDETTAKVADAGGVGLLWTHERRRRWGWWQDGSAHRSNWCNH